MNNKENSLNRDKLIVGMKMNASSIELKDERSMSYDFHLCEMDP